jgi:hypothetical protein
MGHPIGNAEKMENWVKRLKKIHDEGRPIYIVESGFSYDPFGIFLEGLTENFNLEEVGSHPIEDYHKSTITFNRYESRLIRVLPKAN